jgi:hypothetical protein
MLLELTFKVLQNIFKIQKNGKRAFIKPRYKWVHRKKLYEERK